MGHEANVMKNPIWKINENGKEVLLILCKNDEKTFEYMSNVLSRILKNPSKLTHTAEIFKSLPGVGKDTFFNWFGNDMIGKQYYVSTEKPNLLFGQFNSTLKNNILTVINETSGKDTFSISENIKAHITNITLNIEKKGIDPYKVSNCSHVVFLTNNENSIKIES